MVLNDGGSHGVLDSLGLKRKKCQLIFHVMLLSHIVDDVSGNPDRGDGGRLNNRADHYRGHDVSQSSSSSSSRGRSRSRDKSHHVDHG